MATNDSGAPAEPPAAGAPAGGEGAQGLGPVKVKVEIVEEKGEVSIRPFDIVDSSVGIYVRMWLHVIYHVKTPYGEKKLEKTLLRTREVKFGYEIEEEVEDALTAMKNEANEYREWLEEAISKVIETAKKHGYSDIRVV